MLIQELLNSGSALPQGGEMTMGDVSELQKALTAGYGTDSSQFTGAAAFRVQSLDRTMKSTIQERKHFALFNKLQKLGAGATVDEWTERGGIGGFLGGTTNSEVGAIPQQQGSYARQTAQVKFLMTRCEVSFVATLGNNIVPATAAENEAGCLRLLSDAEFLSFDGDSSVNPFEFDGMFTQIQNAVDDGYMDDTHVIDLDGGALTDIQLFNNGASTIGGFGNFGEASDLWCSYGVQRDLDASLDPAWRVPLNGNGDSIKIGSPVTGIRTSFGDISTNKDVFVLDEAMRVPFEASKMDGYSAIAAGNLGLKPANLTTDAANNASSTFNAKRAGNYYYLVCGLNQYGQSTGLVSGQVAVGAGQAVTLTITKSAGGAETGYAIYRSRQNGTSAAADMRLVKRIPAAGATTTFVDANRDIPGSVKASMNAMGVGSDNISWRQLLPMTKFQLYPTNAPVLPWAQMLFGYLRITKRKQNVLYKNIVPTSAVWQPFVPGA